MQNQSKALQEAIRVAQVVLLIASSNAHASRHVQRALQIARIYQSQVCALWIDGENWQECIPKDSGQFFATLDARKQHERKVFEEVIAKLEKTFHTSSATTEVAASTSEPAEPLPEPRNPYKGLEAFHGEDRCDFFGRNRFIDELAQTLIASMIADTLLSQVSAC